MNSWSALSMKERADFIKRSVRAGVFDRKSIIDRYNSFATGGNTDGDENTQTTPINYMYNRRGYSNADIFKLPTEMVSNVQANLYKMDKEGEDITFNDDGDMVVTQKQMTPEQQVEYNRIKYGYDPRLGYQKSMTPEEVAAKQQKVDDAIHLGNSVTATSLNDDKQEMEVQKLEDATNFLHNWYSDPTTKSIVEKQVGVKPFYVLNNGRPQEVNSNDLNALHVETALSYPSAYSKLEDGQLGVFDHRTKNIRIDNHLKEEYNPLIPKEKVPSVLIPKEKVVPILIHEYNHAIQNRLDLYQQSPDVPYNDRQEEIHSNLMEIRKMFGLNPGKRNYTPEEGEQILKQLKAKTSSDSSGANHFFFNLHPVTGATLAKYLNTYADASSVIDNSMDKLPDNIKALQGFNMDNGVHYAKNGGRLLDGTERVQSLSGLPVRQDTLPFKGIFTPEDTMFWSPSESARVDSTVPLVLAREEVVSTPSQEDIDNILNGPKYSVPKGNAENAFVRKANEIIRDKTESDLRKELNSKNEDEIREVQRSLANEGYFDIDLTAGKSSNAEGIQKMLVKEGYLKGSEVDGNIGSHTTEMLQKMLVDKGYLPEFTESGKSNIDGDIGKRTREAFKQFNRDYNVDGIAGEKTTAGYLAKEGKKSLGFNMKVSAEGMVDQCAAWVSKKYDSVVGESKQNGVYGSAWNMLKNVEDSGGQMLFNAYDSPYFDNVKDASGIKKGVVEYMKSNPIDYSILEAGDVVGIHNPSSTHYGDVLKEGTTYNTHVGIVVGVEDGVPIVEHNILGKVRRERIDKLTGSAFGQPTVTVASRPKKGAPLEGQLEFNDVKSKIELPSKPNEQMSEYMDSVASSKETFGKIYKDVDMDFIEKAAIAITKRETGFMTNKQSDVLKGESGLGSMAAAAARKAAHWWRDTPEEVMSQDLTKMKFASLSSQYRKAIGLETPDQLSTDPTITGRAVTLLLSKNYDYFQRLAKKHPELGLTKEDIQNATIWSYNVGLGALASLGFEGSGEYKGEARPKEIERLRAISQPGYKEKDIRATNWKHLGALGEYIYDNFGDPHTPYVAAANETIARLGTKMMYGGTKSTFKSIAERNARKLSSKTLK